MKILIRYTLELSADDRRALQAGFGTDQLSTRDEIQNMLEISGRDRFDKAIALGYGKLAESFRAKSDQQDDDENVTELETSAGFGK